MLLEYFSVCMSYFSNLKKKSNSSSNTCNNQFTTDSEGNEPSGSPSSGVHQQHDLEQRT